MRKVSAVSFQSKIRQVGQVVLPQFQGTRIMMMPYQLEIPRMSLPEYLRPWYEILELMAQDHIGIGYLTIDEAHVRAGETHRRPGLHVDGVGPNGDIGGWGGGGKYASNGMTMVSSHVGCVGYAQDFFGWPGPNGDCEHLAGQISDEGETVLQPGTVYWCSSLAVHQAIPMQEDVLRQFCRVSFPSDAPWYEGYTPNPLGFKPTGPIHPARKEFMDYRP